jgi:hypothetical protein
MIGYSVPGKWARRGLEDRLIRDMFDSLDNRILGVADNNRNRKRYWDAANDFLRRCR